VVTAELDRRLEADERLTDVALRLRLAAAIDQALDVGGHGD
jgi:hypothetical protein